MTQNSIILTSMSYLSILTSLLPDGYYNCFQLWQKCCHELLFTCFFTHMWVYFSRYTPRSRIVWYYLVTEYCFVLSHMCMGKDSVKVVETIFTHISSVWEFLVHFFTGTWYGQTFKFAQARGCIERYHYSSNLHLKEGII